LYGHGDLTIVFDRADSNFITQIKEPQKKIVPKTDTLKLGDVLFDFNKALLKPEAVKILTAYFISNKSANNIDSVYIEGHTDSVGTDKRNLQLSEQRCESVQNWLLLNSVVTPEISFLHPFGKSRPVASNKTLQGRALNRRVEIIIFRKIF
jgi:outer membrane protein OmpA-like peptidoglycan-associated protein